jgi:hypothetical protein
MAVRRKATGVQYPALSDNHSIGKLECSLESGIGYFIGESEPQRAPLRPKKKAGHMGEPHPGGQSMPRDQCGGEDGVGGTSGGGGGGAPGGGGGGVDGTPV